MKSYALVNCWGESIWEVKNNEAIYFGKDMEQKNKDFIASMISDMNKEKVDEDKIKLYDVFPSDKDIFSLERKEYT